MLLWGGFYGYNSGTVYFDDVQLVRNSLETYLSASDFVVESTGTSDDAAAEATDTTPTFNEAKDDFGNALTETTFTDGDFGTIYRAFKFNEDDNCCSGDDAGNNLVEETDARGHKTTYTVDGDTSRNEEVTDRLGNKTAYEYDDSGRTTKVTSKDADGIELAHVSYAYDTFDNMTEIVRGDGMKYALAYNEFHNLESIGIEGKSEALIKYAYKNGNGRLKQMTYANGHTMKAVYNSIGQMVAEKWFGTEAKAADSTETPIAHYKYVYDGDGNIVRSIDISGKKEYNYEYEEGRIVRATEADIELSGEIVTSKVIVNTVKYYYDTYGKLINRTGTNKVIFGYNGRDGVVTDDNGLIYMRARYYAPAMKRFINADVIAGAISNAITLNRFAYANGNPVSFVDPFGLSVWSWIKDKYNDAKDWVSDTSNDVKDWAVDTYNSAKDAVVETYNNAKDFVVNTYNDAKDTVVEAYNEVKDWAVDTYNDVKERVVTTTNNVVSWVDDKVVKPVTKAATAVGDWFEEAGEWLNENARNKDGSYALHDNQRFDKDAVFHEQILAFTPSGPSFNLKEGNVGLGSLSVDALTGGWEGERANLSLLDFGHAEVSAEMKDGQVSVGALASIWSPSFSVTFFGVTIEVGAEVGAIGAGIDIGKKGFKAKGAYAFGASLSVSW